jgi:SAM-dependent methyltransferase
MTSRITGVQEVIGVGDTKYYQEFYSTRTWRDYRWLLSLVVKWSLPGPILDLGAGLGFFVEAATAWGLSCEGLDGSPSAIEIALRRAPHLPLRHHLLHDPLPFAQRSFQTVVCNQVIEHLGSQNAASLLIEIRRILVEGGKLLLFSPNVHNRREALGDPTHVHCFSPSELQRLLLRSGFRSVLPLNVGRPLLGSGAIAAKLGALAFRATRLDRLSAATNFVAEA